MSKRSLREETEKLMQAAPGDTIKCPDCGKVCVSGAFFINHRTYWCEGKNRRISVAGIPEEYQRRGQMA